MRWGRAVFAAIGLLATAVAVAITVLGSAGTGPVGFISGLDSPLFLIGTGIGIVCVGGIIAWMVGFRSATAETIYDAAVESPPEDVTERRGTLAAAQHETQVADAQAGDPDAMDALVGRLRQTAVTIYAVSGGVTRDDAQLAVVAGTWTDDRIAAATLAEDEPQPLVARLRLWLDPEQERKRRIERTITAIRRLDEDKR